mmetsp:Transcript_10380/g.19504  ORF Transcript_10380/g.19504 Transcript_10380/m.19504 type:complete len:93 (+) Transcript_10380:66-344(+)
MWFERMFVTPTINNTRKLGKTTKMFKTPIRKPLSDSCPSMETTVYGIDMVTAHGTPIKLKRKTQAPAEPLPKTLEAMKRTRASAIADAAINL